MPRAILNSNEELIDPFFQTMPRAILNSNEELIAILDLPSSPVDTYKTIVHIGSVLGDSEPRWYWKYITQAEFETYREFGIREIEPPKA